MAIGKMSPWLAGAAIVVAAGALAGEITVPDAVAAPPAYTLTPVEFGMQLKTPDGRVVFEYLTKKPENI